MDRPLRRIVADAADAIERWLATPFTSIMRLLRNLGCARQVVNPTPGALVRKVYNVAAREALPYGPDEPRVCPQYFDITVPQGSWEEFYRHDTEQICRDIAERVYQRICESPTICIERTPRLWIECDPLPGRERASVTAHFHNTHVSAPRGKAARRATDAKAAFQNADASLTATGVDAASAAAAAAAAQAAAPAAPAAAPAASATGSEADPAKNTGQGACEPTILLGDGSAMDSAPRSKAPMAQLSSASMRYLVHDGDTVGVVRGQSAQRPAICLPLETFPFASREHARLSYEPEAESWTFEQLGRHGSIIQRDDGTFELAPGDTVQLAAGDRIAIPRSLEELRFSDEPLARTVLL